MLNPYAEAELENQDLYCEICGELISTQTYINNSGICEQCVETLSENEPL